MKKLIICALVGALIAQIWGMFSWMVLPWHMTDFKQFENDNNVAMVLEAEQQGSGLYTIPNMDPTVHEDEAKMAEWNDKAQKGPFVFMSVQADGVEPGMGKPMAIGFALNLIVAGLLFWLVSNSSITCPIGRTIFIGTAATVGVLYSSLADWNWWYFPTTYCVVLIIDMFITWALAGYAMVRISDSMSGGKSKATAKPKAKSKKKVSKKKKKK